jgi:hypothetical protein
MTETTETQEYKEAYNRFLAEMNEVDRPNTVWYSIDEAWKMLELEEPTPSINS